MSQEIALVNRLDAMGIALRLKDGKLTTRAAPGSITAEIAALIRSQREGLLAFLRQRELGEALKSAAIPALGASSHALSYAQKRLWLIDRMGGAGAAYHMPAALQIDGALDADALERAFGAIIERHQVLRTVYLERDGEPVCEVRPDAPFALGRRTLSAGETLAAAVAAENARPFDLSRDLMLRATLIELGAACHVLLLTMHHIASDGWSMGVLVKEFMALYEGAALPPLALQYGDYAAWQDGWLAGGVQERQLDYWKERLAGIAHLHALPTDYPRPARQRYEGAQFSCVLEDTSALQGLCREAGATWFVALQLAFAILLSRWSNETDIVFGTPVANRLRPELEGLIGFFVNTLVLRNEVDASRSFADLLGEAVRTAAADFDHQSLPFDLLVEALNPVRSSAHPPLVQIMFSMQNNAKSTVRLDGLSLSGVEMAGDSAKFDLTLNVVESEGALTMSWQYCSALFKPATIAAMAQQLLVLLRDIGRHPTLPVSQLDMLAPGERARLLAFNGARTTAAPSAIPQVFRDVCARHPARVALVEGDQRLTYAQLEAKVQRLAAWLVQRGTGDEQAIGIYLDRGIDMVVATLAVLQAGACYVPMDVSMPAERIALIVRDAGCALVLCSARRRAVLAGLAAEAVAVDVLELADAHCALPPARAGRRLAYLMYTSGSTGQPKGAMVEQRGILRLVCDSGYCDIGPQDTVAQSSNISFDASTFEIYAALLNGACLSFIDVDTLLDPARLELALERQGIDVMFMTTALFNQSVQIRPRMFARLRYLLVGGEAVDKHSIERVLRSGGKPRHLLNGYGPTENTTFTTVFDMQEVLPSYPIGRPLRNTSCFVLGRGRELLPVGALGELYTGGDGVARGYLNRPQETAASFIADPLGGDGLLYKTGDLARWLPDGTLEYAGRNDFQVKVRGFRIELGEIEAHLARLDAVQFAAVLARADGPGGKRLVAYVTAAPGAALSAELLRAALAAQLPEYMLPSAYVVLDALPLTANGKLDRRALPAPAPDAYLHEQYEAPRGEREQALAAIWQDLLHLERVGRHDDFFALGGHSLLAVQLCARLRGAHEITLRDVFEQPTLQALARHLDNAALVQQRPIGRADRSDGLPLSWAQQRLWFLEQLGDIGAAYHIPVAVRLVGALDREALRRALDSLVERHESLRTHFMADQQVVDAPAPLALQELDLRGAGEEAIARLSAQEAQAPFDLGRGPLLRACLLKLSDQTHVLLFTMHHIISDGWSMGVLVRELGALYGAYHEGRPNPLAPLAIQYPDYALWQRQWLQGAALQEQLDYWKGQLGGAPALLELPLDRARPSSQSYQGRTIGFALGAELSARLNTLSRARGVTLFMTLYTGFTILLAKLSGQDDVVVGVPVANRQRVELEGLIGFFVNTLALRMQFNEGASVADTLEQAKQMALGAYARQELPFEQVVEALQPPRSLAHSPVFQVMFSMQNTPSHRLELPGLRLEPQLTPARVAQFDLSMALQESGGQIAGEINYASDLFDAATIERWTDHFETVLGAMVSDPAQPVAALSLLSEREKDKVTQQFNATLADYPRACLIHQLFEQQAERTPDAIALSHAGGQLSYAELNGQANRLAHCLRSQGVGPGQLVAICAERNAAMVLGLLAILKAGGAYVPLDPAYPSDRLEHMLCDSRAVALLSQGAVPAALRQHLRDDVPVFDLQGDGRAWRHHSDANPAPGSLHPACLGYVMYTSGSTGLPKGVMVEHGSVVNHVSAFVARLGLGPADRVLQFASVSFDAAVEEIFGSLACGATLVLRTDDWLAGPAAFWSLCAANRISVVDLPTQFWAQLAQSPAPAPACVRWAVIGGEALGERALAAWLANGARPRLLNTYGPTEATVSVTTLEADTAGHWRSIGHPSPNTRIYILDERMAPVPIGVAGELHIGGVQVARGYLNRPDLTAERFVDDPFGGAPGRLYKTGDLGRWRADGSIDYLGRNDFQVKIRGFRIEPGEVEARLAQALGVAMTVLAREDEPGEKRLVAYYTGAAAMATDSLRAQAGKLLPAYMVPAAFVHLPAWPMTPNGKLDRKALPAPAGNAYASRAYAAPQDETEAVLVRIWEALLKVAPVGRQDNFFDLGGHSLLAIQMVAQASAQLGVALAPAAIFTHQSVAALAAMVRATAEAAQQPSSADGHLLLRAGAGGKAPLFCFPGLFANGLEFGAIADAVGEQRSVHAFVCPALGSARWNGASMVELAAMYADRVVAIAGSGQVALLGWSVGGDMAFEVAKQLRQRLEVQFVGMVDVHCPPEATLRPKLPLAAAGTLETMLAQWAGASSMQAQWQALFERFDHEEKQLAWDLLREAPAFASTGMAADTAEYRAWARFNHGSMMRRHAWVAAEVPVHVWCAGQSAAHPEPSLRDWSALARVCHASVIDDSDHRTVLDKPAFLAQLRAQLAASDQGASGAAFKQNVNQ